MKVEQVQANEASEVKIQVNKCKNYQRNCQVQAPCCKIFYHCKLCHDDKFQYKKGCQTERMQFDRVEKLKCLNCETIQLPSQKCSSCNILFGYYSCLKCCLFQSNISKVNDIFHCDQCKMCRRGTPDTVTHCKKCGYCVPNFDDHKCIENNALSNCPICLQVLLYSTEGYINLKCGHLIHQKCWSELQDINCPNCGMAESKMPQRVKKRIEKQIKQTKKKLPSPLKNKKVNILCNQCLHKTMDAPFHFYGIACQKCGTYNTKMM